jgi:hypothetical protein
MVTIRRHAYDKTACNLSAGGDLVVSAPPLSRINVSDLNTVLL